MMLDCRPIAKRILERLQEKSKPQKALAGVIVLEDSVSESFFAQKEKTSKALGISFVRKEITRGADESAISRTLASLAEDDAIGGIILQIPLPKKFDRDVLIARIPVEKDVDVLRGEGQLLPPAVGTLEEILKEINFDIASANIAIVGKGFLVGEPIAKYLEGKTRKVFAMDKDTFAREKLKEADLIIAGTGVPELIHGDDIKEGAVCIDFGYSKKDNVLCGDFHTESVVEKAKYLTPTPGGTGPVLVAKLLENFFALNQA